MGRVPAAHVAATLTALADPLRLRMCPVIASRPTGETCFCDVAGVAEATAPTVSQHLKVLEDVGGVASERRGTSVVYRITPPARRVMRSPTGAPRGPASRR
jgi:arsenate reductase